MALDKEDNKLKMMKPEDIAEGFFGGYMLGFAFVIIYVLIKGFVTWDLGIDSFDFIWKSYNLVRTLIVAGLLGIGFVWCVKYEGR